MKKLLCLLLVLTLAMGIFASCGKKDEGADPAPVAEDAGTPAETGTEVEEVPEVTESTEEKEEKKDDKKEDAEEVEYDVPEPSENKEVVTEDEAPTVYLVVGGDDNAASISYHLDGCKLLSGGEKQEVAWEMVKTLGFRQCPECNPPQYEGYVE